MNLAGLWFLDDFIAPVSAHQMEVQTAREGMKLKCGISTQNITFSFPPEILFYALFDKENWKKAINVTLIVVQEEDIKERALENT